MEDCKHYDAAWLSPVGMLGIAVDNDELLCLDYLSAHRKPLKPSRTLTREVIAQLKAYFTQPGFEFDLPIAAQGTEHQKRVWAALRTIPRGETLSYGELANQLGSGARAVGNACRNNPVSIVVPCHRVVAANGPGGYSGAVSGSKLDRKLWLLEHERAH